MSQKFVIEKSANQLWRESGTTLSFKDWLNREKKKYVNFNGNQNVMMVNRPLNNQIKDTINTIDDTKNTRFIKEDLTEDLCKKDLAK